MKNIAARIAAAFVITFLLGAFSCSPSAYHQAADATAKIASSLAAVQTVNEDLYAGKFIDSAATVAIANYVGAASQCNDRFVARVKSLKSIDNSNGALVSSWWASARGCLEPVLSVTSLTADPQTQAKISLAFTAVSAAVQLVDLLLQPYAPRAAPSQSRATWLAQPTGVNYGPDDRNSTRVGGTESCPRADCRIEGAERHDRRSIARLRIHQGPGDAGRGRGTHRGCKSKHVAHVVHQGSNTQALVA